MEYTLGAWVQVNFSHFWGGNLSISYFFHAYPNGSYLMDWGLGATEASWLSRLSEVDYELSVVDFLIIFPIWPQGQIYKGASAPGPLLLSGPPLKVKIMRKFWKKWGIRKRKTGKKEGVTDQVNWSDLQRAPSKLVSRGAERALPPPPGFWWKVKSHSKTPQNGLFGLYFWMNIFLRCEYDTENC